MRLTQDRAYNRRRQGVVLILVMIFLAVFSSLAVSLASMSTANVQITDNHQKADLAFADAESGLEVLRYWITDLRIPKPNSPADFFPTFIPTLQNRLTNNSITNLIVNNDGSTQPVMLDAATNHLFLADMQMHPSDPNILLLALSGKHQQFTQTIQADLNIIPYEYPIFAYGLATKGPVVLDGNPTVTGVNNSNEADIYIESYADPLALHVTGNTNFDGDLTVGNTSGNVQFDGDVIIAGDHGQAAIDNHVSIGSDPVEFPVPDTEHFRQYATGPVINSTTDISHHMTLVNALIEAGVDPNFEGNIVIEGILFIEAPNIVVFERNVQVYGMIVANGDPNNPGTNSITFLGNFASSAFPPDPEFDALRSEQGSSLLAPGFRLEFAGNFASLAGVMAVSGLEISGNASALVEGSIINYSDSPTVIWGNATLNFDRSNQPNVPAGFDHYRILEYAPSSWSMIY